MRKTPWILAEHYRVPLIGTKFESKYGESFGAFQILYKDRLFKTIVSDGDYKAAGLSKYFAWEHVSVSLQDRTPTWEEMSYIKDLFWREDECVFQFHPPKKDYVNFHPNCLHLWKPLLVEIPLPPKETIA